MPPAERRAVLLLLAVGLVGHGVRLLRAEPGTPPGAVRLLPDEPGHDVRAHLDSIRRLTRPLAPGERIDVDRATADELARLPRIGPGLARRIVADRETRGPFGALAALARVSGIGPTLLRSVEPHVVFTGTPWLTAPDPVPPARLAPAAPRRQRP